jgi:hypothetical protein
MGRKNTRIEWDAEELKVLASAAMRLQDENPDLSPLKAVRQAQEKVLPPNRRRNLIGNSSVPRRLLRALTARDSGKSQAAGNSSNTERSCDGESNLSASKAIPSIGKAGRDMKLAAEIAEILRETFEKATAKIIKKRKPLERRLAKIRAAQQKLEEKARPILLAIEEIEERVAAITAAPAAKRLEDAFAAGDLGGMQEPAEKSAVRVRRAGSSQPFHILVVGLTTDQQIGVEGQVSGNGLRLEFFRAANFDKHAKELDRIDAVVATRWYRQDNAGESFVNRAPKHKVHFHTEELSGLVEFLKHLPATARTARPE